MKISKVAAVNLAIVLLTGVYSCKKQDLVSNHASQTDVVLEKPKIVHPLVTEAKNFFAEFHSGLPAEISLTSTGEIGSKAGKPKLIWAEAKVNLDGKFPVVAVPLQFEKPLQMKLASKKGYQGGTFTVLQLTKKADKKFKVSILSTFPENQGSSATANVFSGLTVERKLSGEITKAIIYRSGKPVELKKPRESDLAAKEVDECIAIDYYECDDIDEFGVGTNCRYLYTEYIGCFDDDGGGGTGGGSGEGGGGGGSGNDDPEVVNCSPLTDVVAASQTVAETIGYEINDINAITKYKNPKWMVLKNFPWALFSMETGVIELVDPTSNTWVWKSLQHDHIYMVGAALPGIGVSFSKGIGTPSFVAGTPNMFYAGMLLDFTVTYSFIGKESWCPGMTLSYTSESTMWPAKP